MSKEKLKTPEWILEGYNSPEEYNKAKGKPSKKEKDSRTFKIRECPKCHNDEVKVLLTGEEGKTAREWECKKCKWHGKDIEEEELTEDEFMKYLDDNGEEVA